MSPTDSTTTEITTSDTHEEQLSEHTEAQEEAWPGDRNPSANDAAEAYSPLNIDFLPTFRNGVLAESQSRAAASVAGIDTIGSILARSMAIDPLFWPMGMFSTSSIPDNIDQLVSQCSTGFLQTTIFLRDAPVSLFTHSPRPQYLTLALAAIGSLLAGEAAEVSAQYWHDAVRLMTGELEIDNREARSFDLLKAWLLLETYAVLSSDQSVWKQANMAHGYVETAVSRLIRQDQLHLRENDPPADYILALLSYFRLIDLLRAIHYNQPATFAGGDPRFLHPEATQKLKAGESLNTSTDSASASSTNSIVLQLVDIFADAHALKILALDSHTGGHSVIHASTNFTFTAYAPLSFDVELQKAEENVLAELDSWKEAHFATATNDIRLLYLFCHMYLLSDKVQHMFASSGYRSGGPCREHHQVPVPQQQSGSELLLDERKQKDALAISDAWRILDTSEGIPTTSMPPWGTLAVFSAALVVSADLLSLSPSLDKERLRVNARQLRAFQLEIYRMNVPCTKRMADVLGEM